MKFTVVVTSTNDSNDLVMYDFICNDLPLILYVILYVMICFYYYPIEPPSQNGQTSSTITEPQNGS